MGLRIVVSSIQLISQFILIAAVVYGLALVSFVATNGRNHVPSIVFSDKWTLRLTPSSSIKRTLAVICCKYAILITFMTVACVAATNLIKRAESKFVKQWFVDVLPTVVVQKLSPFARRFTFYVHTSLYVVKEFQAEFRNLWFGRSRGGFWNLFSKVRVVATSMVTPQPASMDRLRRLLGHMCTAQFCNISTLKNVQSYVQQLNTTATVTQWMNLNPDSSRTNVPIRDEDRFTISVLLHTHESLMQLNNDEEDRRFVDMMRELLRQYNSGVVYTLASIVMILGAVRSLYAIVNEVFVRADSLIELDRVTCERTPGLILLDRALFILLWFGINNALRNPLVLHKLFVGLFGNSNGIVFCFEGMPPETVLNPVAYALWLGASMLSLIRDLALLLEGWRTNKLSLYDRDVTVTLSWSTVLGLMSGRFGFLTRTTTAPSKGYSLLDVLNCGCWLVEITFNLAYYILVSLVYFTCLTVAYSDMYN